MTKEEAEQIAAEIVNEGFDYWIENYAGSSLKNYPELVKLAAEANEAISNLEKGLKDAGVNIYG